MASDTLSIISHLGSIVTQQDFLTKERKLLRLKPSPKTPAAVVLLQMCHNFREVNQLHAHFVVTGFLRHAAFARRLLECYVSMSQVVYALSIFDRIPSPDVFAYNTMMRGLTSSQHPCDALLLYDELIRGWFMPDNYSYTFVLKACSHLKAVSKGRQVHCQIIKSGIVEDTHVHSSLIHMYCNSGCIRDAESVLREFSEENTHVMNSMISGYLSEGMVNEARDMFNTMKTKDVTSWSAMLTGYTRNGMHNEALSLFADMNLSHISPNEATLVSLLSACAHLGALYQGRWIHAYIDRIGANLSTPLATALIDMYAKCGCVECGYELFLRMPQRDIVTWGAMISGFSISGKAAKCFKLFDEMIKDRVHPNGVIFVSLLSACAHARCVEEGSHYFKEMIDTFGIVPSIEHYGCMVDLLGRAGHLAEAEEFINSMSEKPNSVVWGSMLGACRIHNDVRRGRWAFKHLMELEPMSGDRYKLAESMFVNAGEREEAAKIRKIMSEKEMETTCGSSLIEVDGIVHEFVVADIVHEETREIYSMWKGIHKGQV